MLMNQGLQYKFGCLIAINNQICFQMKMHIIKYILLALPLLTLIYVFVLRDRLSSGNSIGGGSYDLTKMFTVVGVGAYLLIFNLFLLFQNPTENKILLLIGFVLLMVTMIKAANIFS